MALESNIEDGQKVDGVRALEFRVLIRDCKPDESFHYFALDHWPHRDTAPQRADTPGQHKTETTA